MRLCGVRFINERIFDVEFRRKTENNYQGPSETSDEEFGDENEELHSTFLSGKIVRAIQVVDGVRQSKQIVLLAVFALRKRSRPVE